MVSFQPINNVYAKGLCEGKETLLVDPRREALHPIVPTSRARFDADEPDPQIRATALGPRVRSPQGSSVSGSSRDYF